MKTKGIKNAIISDNIKGQLEIQSMVIPGLIFLLIFSYIPMYGLQMAFKDYNLLEGFRNSDWAGMKYFVQFLTDPYLGKVIVNTLAINGLGLLLGFPAPIILALLLNELPWARLKKTAQTVSYLPHFLSWVIFGGLALEILSNTGVINAVLLFLGLIDSPVNFMAKGDQFYMIITILSIIKTMGYGSILYVAAIAGVDQEMYEAAIIDGAGRFQKIWYITIPSILGTVVIMLIFQISAIFNTGFEQIFILQNNLNLAFSETIDTYVYKIGIKQGQFSYAAAVGLVKSVISVILLVGANTLSKKITDKGLF